MSRDSEQEELNLRKLQLTELGILKEIVRICERHGIRYYLLGGTFLGAIRHEGFIPWDDDIDIGMPRPDYEQFMEISQNELPERMIYKNFRVGNENTIYIARVEDPAVRVEDSSAAVIRQRYAWVDIFPLDGMPGNRFRRELKKMKLLYLRLMYKYSMFNTVVGQKQPGRPLHEKLLIALGRIVKPEKYLDPCKRLAKLDRALRANDYDDSEYVVNFMGAYKFKEMFPAYIYRETAVYLFEGETLTAPLDYDRVLRQLYGDYMKEPDEKHKNRHCVRVIDTEEDIGEQ